jgi:hypothetical protein
MQQTVHGAANATTWMLAFRGFLLSISDDLVYQLSFCSQHHQAAIPNNGSSTQLPAPHAIVSSH